MNDIQLQNNTNYQFVFIKDNHNDYILEQIYEKDWKVFLEKYEYDFINILPVYRKRSDKQDEEHEDEQTNKEIENSEEDYKTLKYKKDYSTQFILLFSIILKDIIIDHWINNHHREDGVVKVIRENANQRSA